MSIETTAKTLVDVSVLPYPERVKELGRQLCDLKASIAQRLEVFRAGLLEFARPWMRDAAKRIAISQNHRTLAIGRQGLSRLKREMEDHVKTLPALIAEEFTLERYGDAETASSGQVAAFVERRVEGGIRKVLVTLYPILEGLGYVRDDKWVDKEPADPGRGHYSYPLELPPDLVHVIAGIAEAIADEKVVEAKITYYDQQRDRELAAELWENS